MLLSHIIQLWLILLYSDYLRCFQKNCCTFIPVLVDIFRTLRIVFRLFKKLNFTNFLHRPTMMDDIFPLPFISHKQNLCINWRMGTLDCLHVYCVHCLLLVEQSVGSNTNHAWTPPLVIHSRHVEVLVL